MKFPQIRISDVVQIISIVLALATLGLIVTFALGSQTPKKSTAPDLKVVPAPPKRQRLKPRYYLIIKRWMDIGISAGLIVLLAPLMVVLAIGIMLDGKGSPIVKLERVGSRVRGKGGRFSWETKGITLYRFRTAQDTEAIHNTQANSKVKYTIKRNSRPSPIDYILRRTRFDTLPTLFNVLKGDISLVGPRPATTDEVEGYSKQQLRRLEAIAGMTGLWQVTKPVLDGDSVSLEKMIEKDIWYVDNKSLLRDVKIIVLTPFMVLAGRLFRERT
jgi:lipopolysaccharide/colanic/teichoic acid biosynthesis glycosyltransferase